MAALLYFLVVVCLRSIAIPRFDWVISSPVIRDLPTARIFLFVMSTSSPGRIKGSAWIIPGARIVPLGVNSSIFTV